MFSLKCTISCPSVYSISSVDLVLVCALIQFAVSFREYRLENALMVQLEPEEPTLSASQVSSEGNSEKGEPRENVNERGLHEGADDLVSPDDEADNANDGEDHDSNNDDVTEVLMHCLYFSTLEPVKR
ncbi:hypothetical protein L6452_05914 [Arctium lappa]|uniref:Uncharacterized protein n=1 Tax=Arctium lappa TaxID=4217 RepID=A0ACB9EHG2_ARCLA|nr:hypothetical protein L6452_05914 [Arctium lappa]